MKNILNFQLFEVANFWDENWKESPEWELMQMLGFRDVTKVGDEKRKITVTHPSLGYLNLTKAGYVRNPSSQGFLHQGDQKSLFDYCIKRVVKKSVSSIPRPQLEEFIRKNPQLIDLFYELPALVKDLSAATGARSSYESSGFSPAVIKWLNNCAKNWRVNPSTGLVDVDSFKSESKSNSGFRGVKFGECLGNFIIMNAGLTSLAGAPQRVMGDFNCSSNLLTSLEGGPSEVIGNYGCNSNSLTSLKGAPEEVGGSFYCANNKLESLKGGPLSVRLNLSVVDNPLRTVKGFPNVGGDIIFGWNTNSLVNNVSASLRSLGIRNSALAAVLEIVG
jgi:hypothetical protein